VTSEVRFCTAPDGTRLAWTLHGSGPPLVRVATWLTHLDRDRDSPVWRHWLDRLGASHTLLRYDERGCGLSDTQIGDPSVETWVGDLQTVVEAAGLDRFALLGVSQGAAVAVAYAARHPERVSGSTRSALRPAPAAANPVARARGAMSSPPTGGPPLIDHRGGTRGAAAQGAELHRLDGRLRRG